MEETIVKKPLGFFKLRDQIRRDFGDEEEENRLGLSLKEGQLNPVIAYADGVLICGERRFRAAQRVGLDGLYTRIIDRPLSETELMTLQLAENIHRLQLNPYELWQACVELKKFNPDWTYRDISERIKFERSSVVRFMSPSNTILEVQEALRDGKIGIGTCYSISKFPPEKQAAKLAEKLAGKSRDKMEADAKQEKSRNGSTKKPAMGKVKIPLPDGGEITIAAPALTLEYLINLFTNLGKEIKKAQGEDLDARTWAAAMSCKAIKNRLGQGPDGTNGIHHHPSSN